MSASTATKLSRLLKNIKHHDKDERFMCVSDIAAELEHGGDATVDQSMQQTLIRALMPLLDDPSVDVQTVTVKTLSLTVKYSTSDSVMEATDRLTALIRDASRRSCRDLYAMALKTVITTVRDDAATVIGQRIVSGLLLAIPHPPSSDDVNVVEQQAVAIDVIKDALVKFAPHIPATHEPLISALTPLLSHSVDTIRRRTIAAIATLSPALNEALFTQLLTTLTGQLANSSMTGDGDAPTTYAHIQSVSTIASSAHTRLGKHLPLIMPQLIKFTTHSAQKQIALTDGETVCDIWDNALSAYESIIIRCPHDVTQYIPDCVGAAMSLATFDPNFAGANDGVNDENQGNLYHDDNGESMTDNDVEQGGGGGGGGWGDDDGDDGYGDELLDEDMSEEDDHSWKVRRAAMRTLAAFIRHRADLLPTIPQRPWQSALNTADSYYAQIYALIIARITERDHNVLTALYSALHDLIAAAKPPARLSSALTPVSDALTANTTAASQLLNALSHQLNSLMIATINAYNKKEGRHHSADTKVCILTIWREICRVRVDGVDEWLDRIVPLLLNTVAANQLHDAKIRTQILLTVRALINQHTDETTNVSNKIATFARAIADTTLDCLRESAPLKAESLRIISALIAQRACGELTEDLASKIFFAVFEQLQVNDIDVDVKEAAIDTMSIVLSRYGRSISERHSDTILSTLSTLHQRLLSELTRLSALRALSRIANANTVSLALILNPTIMQLCEFMKKNSALLRQETCKTLHAIILHSQRQTHNHIQSTVYDLILINATAALNDTDLHTAQLACDLLAHSLVNVSQQVQVASERIGQLVSTCLTFIQSPLLHGAALTSLIQLFIAILQYEQAHAVASSSAVTYASLIRHLSSSVNRDTSVSTTMNVAQCISALSLYASADDVTHTLDEQINIAAREQSAAHDRRLALYVLAFIGSQSDLARLLSTVQPVILKCFATNDDTIVNAAAYALGSIAIGSVNVYLHAMMKLIQDELIHRYALLMALKQLISGHTGETSAGKSKGALLLPHVGLILPVLVDYTESDEESVRSMISECIGGLLLVSVADVMTALIALAKSEKPYRRAVSVTALRHAIVNVQNKPTPHADADKLSDDTAMLAADSVAVTNTDDTAVAALLSAVRSQLAANFIPLMKDDDLTVRREALVTVSALAHQSVTLHTLMQHADVVLPIIYDALKPNPALIRVVDMGPFKHRIDDGLPVRKAANAALTAIVLSGAPIDVAELFPKILAEMSDVEDLQCAAWALMERAAVIHERNVSLILDALTGDLMSALKNQLRAAKEATAAEVTQANASATDNGASGSSSSGGSGTTAIVAGRGRDVLRCAVRCLLTMRGLEQIIHYCPAFNELYSRVLKTSLLAQIMNEIVANH